MDAPRIGRESAGILSNRERLSDSLDATTIPMYQAYTPIRSSC
jgi:hypothetical protein